MDQIYNDDGKPFHVGTRLAAGGEGTVFRLANAADYCVKIYHKTHLPDSKTTLKLNLLKSKYRVLDGYAALPGSLAHLTNVDKSNPVGVFLKLIKGNDIFEVYNPSSRDEHFPNRRFDFLVRVALNLSRAFNVIHENAIVLGDISEKNVKVRADGTVTIIDCDSFQVHTGNFIFRCPVGTPLWTPPELHGVDLATVDRTINHDNFGLAQLIFLLLFAGRYPFAGVSPPGQYLPPDEAIRKYAFAYAGFSLPLGGLLGPPPGAPPFGALPEYIQKSFLRAFLRGSGEPGSRPSTTEWIDSLTKLENELKQCPVSRGHIYWRNGKSCPWCDVLRDSKWDIFPYFGNGSEHESATPKFDFSRRCEELCTVVSPQPFLTNPPEEPIPVFRLPPKPSGAIARIKKSVSHAWWVKAWLHPHYTVVLNEKRENSRELEGIFREHEKISKDLLRTIDGLPIRALSLRRILGDPNKIVTAIEAKYKDTLRQEQLQSHLARFNIGRAVIEGIGPNRKATLASYGVTTAKDISFRQVCQIPGFGTGLFANLDSWRSSVERTFVYDSRIPFSPRMRIEVQRTISEELNKSDREAAKIVGKYRDAMAVYEREGGDIQERYCTAITRARLLESQESNLLSYLKRGGAEA